MLLAVMGHDQIEPTKAKWISRTMHETRCSHENTRVDKSNCISTWPKKHEKTRLFASTLRIGKVAEWFKPNPYISEWRGFCSPTHGRSIRLGEVALQGHDPAGSPRISECRDCWSRGQTPRSCSGAHQSSDIEAYTWDAPTTN